MRRQASPRSPRLQGELDRMEAAHARAHDEASRDSRRRVWRACLECAVAGAAGLVVMAMGFRVEGVEMGKAFLYGGLAVGYGGIGVALWRAYRRAEAAGDL